MTAETVRRHLNDKGVPFETRKHPGAFTARETAAVTGVPPRQIAKVVMLDVDDQLVMAVVPGDKRVDLDKAKEALDATSVTLAPEDEFVPAFPDCEPGAEPPFGYLYGIPTVVDRGLAGENITFPAGCHEETMTMSLEHYLSLAGPTTADLTED